MNTPDHSIKYIHYRPFSFRASTGVCIGFKLDRMTGEADVAIFIPPGEYNKRVARMACSGRLAKQKKIEVKVDPSKVCESIIMAVRTFLHDRGVHDFC
jgi:hypothetical protein